MHNKNKRECKCKRKIRWQFIIERAVRLVIRYLPLVIRYLPYILDFLKNLF